MRGIACVSALQDLESRWIGVWDGVAVDVNCRAVSGVGWIIADRAVASVDVIAVLGEARAVEQFEVRSVGNGKNGAVDEGMGLVALIGRVERPECGCVGIVDFECLAGEGIQVIDRVVPDVVAGRLGERVRRAVSAARQHNRHSE